MKFIALAFAATAALVSAQEPTVHTVQVGLKEDGTPGPAFTPSAIKAKAGDQVAFQFRAKNHTVTQSSFAEPCTRQFNTALQELGVDSGFQPVAPDATEIPVWTIQVENDSAPQWFFCNFGGATPNSHCNAGMVFSINAQDEGQGERTHAAFLAKAKEATHPAPESSVSADFTPPTPTAPAGGDSAPPAANPTGELSTTTLGGENGANPPANPPAGETPPTGSNTAPNANQTDPAAAGSPAFAVKASGVAASLVALVAALAL
jgi:plastocyanin